MHTCACFDLFLVRTLHFAGSILFQLSRLCRYLARFWFFWCCYRKEVDSAGRRRLVFCCRSKRYYRYDDEQEEERPWPHAYPGMGMEVAEVSVALRLGFTDAHAYVCR